MGIAIYDLRFTIYAPEKNYEPRKTLRLVNRKSKIVNLFQFIKILLQNLPVLQVLGLFAGGGDDLGLVRVLGGAVNLVEDAKLAGECFAGEFVGRDCVVDIVFLR